MLLLITRFLICHLKNLYAVIECYDFLPKGQKKKLILNIFICAVTTKNISIEFVTQEPECKSYSESVAFSADTFVSNKTIKSYLRPVIAGTPSVHLESIKLKTRSSSCKLSSAAHMWPTT